MEHISHQLRWIHRAFSLCKCPTLNKCFPCSCIKRRNRSKSDLHLIASRPIQGPFLLPRQTVVDKHCMVIDLDETLVHSTFAAIDNPDFVIPVEMNGVVQNIYVLKRPHVDEFLQKVGQLYECVLFTASLSLYAERLTNQLDKWNVFKTRLFRESCVFHQGCYIKDLNMLGRNLERVVILDNSPVSYMYHPDNAVPVPSWFDDKTDAHLLYMIPFLERLAKIENVYTVLRNSNHPLNDLRKKTNLTKEFQSSV